VQGVQPAQQQPPQPLYVNNCHMQQLPLQMQQRMQLVVQQGLLPLPLPTHRRQCRLQQQALQHALRMLLQWQQALLSWLWSVQLRWQFPWWKLLLCQEPRWLGKQQGPSTGLQRTYSSQKQLLWHPCHPWQLPWSASPVTVMQR
jgi:hypothetical protein